MAHFLPYIQHVLGGSKNSPKTGVQNTTFSGTLWMTGKKCSKMILFLLNNVKMPILGGFAGESLTKKFTGLSEKKIAQTVQSYPAKRLLFFIGTQCLSWFARFWAPIIKTESCDRFLYSALELTFFIKAHLTTADHFFQHNFQLQIWLFICNVLAQLLSSTNIALLWELCLQELLEFGTSLSRVEIPYKSETATLYIQHCCAMCTNTEREFLSIHLYDFAKLCVLFAISFQNSEIFVWSCMILALLLKEFFSTCLKKQVKL